MKISLCSVCYNYLPKYTFVILWLGLNGVLFWDTFCEYKYGAPYYYTHEMLGVGLCVSRAAATVLNLNLGALLLPMCKSLMAALRGCLPLISKRSVTCLIDRCKGFHILCAYLVVIATIVHTVSHLFNAKNFSAHYNSVFEALNAAEKPQQDPLYIVLTSWPCISGLLMVLIFVMILTSATVAVRSASYDLFWFSHRLYVLLYGLTVVHGLRGILRAQSNLERHTPGCMRLNYTAAYPEPESHPEVGFPEAGFAEPSLLDPDHPEWICDEMPQFARIPVRSWMWVGLPLILFACDTLYSYIRRHLGSVQVTMVTAYPGNILQISMLKENVKIRPGQYILLQCPGISSFELHPFTVSKVPTAENPEFSVHLKPSGDWTEKAKKYFQQSQYIYQKRSLLLPLQQKRPKLYLEGPYGSPMEDVLRYRVSILIAGGIGITPFAAVLNYILDTMKLGKLERLYLVWVNRDPDTVVCFSELLLNLHTKLWMDNLPDFLELRLHMTGQRVVPSGGCLRPEVDTFISRRITRGRPCWRRLLNKMASTYPGYHIGVFSCGPKSLNNSLQKHILRKNHSSSVFHYYHESF